jgi:hypothetical protein
MTGFRAAGASVAVSAPAASGAKLERLRLLELQIEGEFVRALPVAPGKSRP